MKTIVTLLGGAVELQEQAGDFYLSFNGSLGGGEAAGIVSGQGSIKLGTGSVGLKLGEAWVNAHAPAYMAPFLQGAEAAINGYVAGL